MLAYQRVQACRGRVRMGRYGSILGAVNAPDRRAQGLGSCRGLGYDIYGVSLSRKHKDAL